MQTDEKRWHGCRYYTVEPNIETWRRTIGGKYEYIAMHEWCEEQFGPEGDVWEPKGTARWYHNGAKFWFRDKNELLMFMLRWS